MESRSIRTRLSLGRFGFVISPPTPPYVPDILLCSVDAHSPLVSVVGGLCSDVTPVSARNLSRWLFLLARHSARARPVRPPAVYRPITVVGTDVFVRCLYEVGTETFPCDSSGPLPPGCYALFEPNGNPYPYPVGRTMPRPTFARTEPTWDVPDDHHHATYRMGKPVPEQLANEARQRDQGLCCFTGRPSNFITWIIPPLLSRAVAPPTFSREQCISVDNVFTISSDLLTVYHDNRITIDPQDGYRIVVFEEFPHVSLLDRLGSPPSSGRFWRASLCWTLAVRFAGCDAGFDGVSAFAARELLDELTWDQNMIPQGPEWSTSAGQEAIRTFFWARTGTSALPQERTPPPSPSHCILSSPDEADLGSESENASFSHSRLYDARESGWPPQPSTALFGTARDEVTAALTLSISHLIHGAEHTSAEDSSCGPRDGTSRKFPGAVTIGKSPAGLDGSLTKKVLVR
ncbi:hypothetical protein DFH08DRAFT_942976 [Mycena albidolilacea]|uniref:Uncharacterized protein n=1 Tax=Mycena albidolilacea TaxID=1033008 RepID=A0AAD6ZBT5_9AGAR|nr:hypothetical protein DFH08DRAFT_942976 [Mycena albidolilacea]